MKKFLVVLLAFGLLIGAVVPVSLAQEEVAPADAPAAVAEDETDYSFGTVKSVGTDQIVVSEYDYEADKDVDVTYAVDASAQLENAASLKDIVAGDNVEIDFVNQDGKKVAKLISVEKPIAEEEIPVAEPEQEPAE